MNILFLSIVRFHSINERGIYTDLMRKFIAEGHQINIVYPTERRFKEKTELFVQDGVSFLKIRTLNIQKTNLIEKGIAILSIESQFLYHVKKNFRYTKFDLVLYTTPPVTFTSIIKYIKQRDGAKSYLLLKDIFPQNAVDLGFLSKNSLLHLFFKYKERELYRVSDFIGCMSPANVDFVINQNPQINPENVEINPNSVEPCLELISSEEIGILRQKYHIPTDVIAFIYGGNLGKPQGIDFLIEVLISNKENRSAFFVIVGDGTEYSEIEVKISQHQIRNVILMKSLPKNDYDKLLLACDVGLIFLDKRFTIPNFPSRLLSYLEARIPVLAAIDLCTDLGRIMQDNGYGFWLESGDIERFNHYLNLFTKEKNILKEMGDKGYEFLLENYLVKHSYDKIMTKF